MTKARTVLDLAIGETAFIKSCANQNYACKLLTLGLLPKARISVVRKAPFGGALYLKINEHQIAVRKKEAQHILVDG